MSENISKSQTATVSVGEFNTLFRALCRWGRWGWDDQDGAVAFPHA
jgi:hypothetical protein